MRSRITRILAATDFSRGSREALAYADTLRRQTGAALFIVHVVEDPTVTGVWPEMYVPDLPDIRRGLVGYAHKSLAAETKRLRLAETTTEVAIGPAAQTIAALAERLHCDLIVMGTHGRSGLAHVLLGSVAERVLRMAHCPVLAVRETRRTRRRARGRVRRAA